MQTVNFNENQSSSVQLGSNSGLDDQTLIINRWLEHDQANLTITCPPGKITLLQDSDTGCLIPYQNALAGLDDSGFSLSVGSNKYNHRQHALVGFNEKLPEESILAYLTRSGLSQAQVETAVRRYEFAQYKYLTCAQLSQTASRQVSLLSACNSASNILILNDPFQPFSGRWREHFAEMLLQEAKEKNRTIVIVNLSFMPQVWNDDSSINLINVSKSHEKAAQAAKEKKIREERLREQKRIEAEKAKQAAEKNGPRTISFETTDGKKAEILDPSLSAYKASKDYFFAPIAAISRALRFFSGPALTLSLGLFLLIGSIVMFPGIRHKWEAMRGLSSQTNVTKHLQEALSKAAETKLAQNSGGKAQAPNEAEAEAVLLNVSGSDSLNNLIADQDELGKIGAEVSDGLVSNIEPRQSHFRYNQTYISPKARRSSRASLSRAAAERSRVLRMIGASMEQL